MEARIFPAVRPTAGCRRAATAARPWRAAVLAVVLACSMGARHQTPNYIVETADPQLAQQFGQAAEKYRHDLAIEWLGAAMPNWAQPCKITVHVGPQLGAGGATTFVFDRGEVFGWRMTIQGSAERVLDSVLPHEITHMVFASHFRQPLPRWADEGGATSVEHPSERAKHYKMLVQFLHSGRGIAFNQMFAMTEYPRDVMPLYAQGYTLAEFLIQHGGRRSFVQFLDDGIHSDDWPGAVRRKYGVADLSALQNTWLAWVRQGFPEYKPQEQPGVKPAVAVLASNAPAPSAPRDGPRQRPAPNLIYHIPSAQASSLLGRLVPVQGTASGQPSATPVARPEPGQLAAASPRRGVHVLPSTGWHPIGTPAPTQEAAVSQPAATAPTALATPAAVDPFQTQVSRPQPFEQPRQTIMEWSR